MSCPEIETGVAAAGRGRERASECDGALNLCCYQQMRVGGGERGTGEGGSGAGEAKSVAPSAEGALYHSANVFAAGNRADRQTKASRMDAKIAPKQINF